MGRQERHNSNTRVKRAGDRGVEDLDAVRRYFDAIRFLAERFVQFAGHWNAVVSTKISETAAICQFKGAT